MTRDARLRLAQDLREVRDREIGLGKQRQDAQARALAGRAQRAVQGVEIERRRTHDGLSPNDWT